MYTTRQPLSAKQGERQFAPLDTMRIYGHQMWAQIARADWRPTMNILLWVLQALAALMYLASGVMKIFLFDKVSEGVPSFGAMPRGAWTALGILELVCTAGLIFPAVFHWHPTLTVVAAAVLAIESLVFVWVHSRYDEMMPVVLSGVLGLLMAFVAYGRMFLNPIF